MNFRRTTPGSKYRFNKRGIERRLDLLTPAKSTFDERSRTLRDAQYRRIIEDLENRVFIPKEDHEGLSEQHETTFQRYRRRLRDAQKIQQLQRVHSRQFRDVRQQPRLRRKTKSAIERINERRRSRGLTIEAETEQIRRQVDEVQCEDYRAGTSRWANCMYHRRVGN